MWVTEWKLRLRCDWRWWIVGFFFIPGWNFTLALGPVGLELSKSQSHI